MQLVALLGLATYMVAGLVIGCRLLWLGRGTRQTPELGIGSAFLVGPVGFALLVMASLEPFRGWFTALASSGVLFVEASTATLFVVIWRIYRPGAVWARLLALGGVAACAIVVAVCAVLARQPLVNHALAISLVNATGVVAYGWCVWEGIRYAALLRRRLSLGLTDPELVNRFECWAYSSSATLGIYLLSAIKYSLLDPGLNPTVLMFQAACGLVSAVANWLTFFPPAAYRAWLLRDAAPQAS